MKRDLVETIDATEPVGGNRLTALVRQLKTWEERFPSASQGLLSIADQGVVSATGFLTAAIAGHLTSPDDLGLYYLVLSLVVTISGVQDTLIAAPYMVLSKRRHGRALDTYGGSMWLHQLVLTTITMVGVAAAIAVFSWGGRSEIMPGLWALLGAGPLLVLRDAIRRYTFANLDVKSAIALDVAVAVFQLGGLLAIGYFGSVSVISIYAVMGGACALACLGWFVLDRPHVLFSRRRMSRDWSGNWAFGKWAMWSYMVSGTTPAVMMWSLGLAIEPAATAKLGVCTTLVGMTNVIISGLANVLTPLAAKAYATGGAGNLRRILTRAAAFIGIVIGGVCLAMLPLGNWLVVLVFGELYDGVGMIPFVLALSALMTGLGMVAGNGLWAIHQPHSAFYADACGMVATLIAASLLIVPFGVLGAALATLSGSATAAVLRIAILLRQSAEELASTAPTADVSLCSDGAC